MPEHDADKKVRVRWSVVALVTTIGLVVTCAPFVLAWQHGKDFGEWQSLLSSTMTNIGTAILLVAAFWFVERGFTARIKSEVEETTRATVIEETRELTATQLDLSQRLDEIQERLSARVTKEREAQDDILRRLGTRVSFDSVHSALGLADSLGALWHDELTVPVGSGDSDLPRFTFRLSWFTTVPPHRLRDDDRPTAMIEVEHVPPKPGAARSLVVHWESGTAPDVFLAELRRTMIAAGFAAQAASVDASLFVNLHAALDEAIGSRRHDADSWLKGTLTEWVNRDWAVTSYGLEHRGSHSMRSADFPVNWDGRSNAKAVFWKAPPAPDGVDPDFWTFLIARARRRHRLGVPFPTGGARQDR